MKTLMVVLLVLGLQEAAAAAKMLKYRVQLTDTRPVVFSVNLFVYDNKSRCGGDAMTHSLKFFTTVSSQVTNLPEYVEVGMLDDVQITSYDSSTEKVELKQEWMSQVTAEDPQYLERETGSALTSQVWYKDSIKTLKQRFNQTEGVHSLQRMHGCEWADETDEVTGFEHQGYDGEDFISFDPNTRTWIAHVQQAFISKHKWDSNKPIMADWVNYLTLECPELGRKYLKYGRSSLMRTVLPSVSLLRKSSSSPISCHATGFHPNRAEMVWKKNGEELHEGVRKGEILPNHDGTFQMSVDLDLSAVGSDDWDRYSCVFQLSGVNEDVTTRLTKGGVRTNEAAKMLKYRVQLTDTRPVVFSVNLFVYDNKSRCGGDAMTHSLKFFTTVSSQVTNLPEYVEVGMLDDVQITSYDSSTEKYELKQEWMSQVTAEDPQYVERETGSALTSQVWYKDSIKTLQQRFNHTEGVHSLQRMYGCEWDDETDEVTGFEHQGYDGEDFISFDPSTRTWIAHVHQALISKHKWDSNKPIMADWVNYLTLECPEWGRKYLKYGRSSLMRTVLPSVSLLQKSSSSPISCHATGFYPNRAEMVWKKNGEELHEGVRKGEILPNHDGTFQMSVDLDLSAVGSDDWDRYSCVFQLSGVNEDVTTRLTKGGVRTNEG